MKKALIVFFLLMFLSFFIMRINADELDDVNNLLNTYKTDLTNKESDYQKLVARLNNIKAKVVQIEVDIVTKEEELKKGEEVLAYQKILLNERAKSYYKNNSLITTSLIDMFLSDSLSNSVQKMFYQKSIVDEDKRAIIKIVLYIKNLEEIRTNLISEKSRLAVIKLEVDKQSTALSSQINETRQKIAELSARQQQLIAQKLASLNISRSASAMGRCDSDLTNGRDPGFSPRIAFFTYGVPNRVGMNQYGAKGRADKGQNEEEILRSYYNFDLKKDYSQDIMINVEGRGSYKIDDYVKRIFEIPADWNMSALKAQAIAARSYALAYTNNGQNSICDSEQCQVFHNEEKGGRWNEAVDVTKGWVMVKDGNPIKAWFSSTHGGYVFSSGEIGWSGTSWTKHANDFTGSVNSFSDLNNNAYDKESPWFYCDWGSRSEFNKTAWLKPSEVADITNVIMLVKKDLSVGEHLYQPDKPPSGADVWDVERIKSELRSRGGSPYNNVSDVSVSADFGSGRSTSVNVNGDAGSNSFDAAEFKNWFNLRAPANIQIVGPLFNAEKR